MAYNLSALFDLKEQGGNYREISATIQDTTPSGTKNVYYEVIGPITTIKAANFAAPDATLTNTTPQSLPVVQIPLDGLGAILEGNYQLKTYIENTANPGVYEERSCSIDLDVRKQGTDNCRLKANIGFDVDCVCAKITVSDNTDYKDTELLSREIEVIPPKVPNNPAPPIITTTDKTVTIGFDYSNVTYDVNLYSVYRHYSQDGCIEVQEDLPAVYSKLVVCDINLCKLISCINETFAKIQQKAGAVGGFSNLDAYTQDQVFLVSNKLLMLNTYKDCGDYEKVYEIYQELEKILGCDCGCDTGEGLPPVLVNPACGTASGISGINATSPIIVTVVSGVANISLDPSFLATVNAKISTVTVSNTGVAALVVTPIAGGFNINFNDALLNYGSWTVLGDAQVLAAAFITVSTTPIPLRYRVNGFLNKIQIAGSFRFSPPSPVPGTGICMLENAAQINLATARVGEPIPVFDDNGECVGSIQLIGIGSNRNILFTPNSNHIPNSICRVNGTIATN